MERLNGVDMVLGGLAIAIFASGLLMLVSGAWLKGINKPLLFEHLEDGSLYVDNGDQTLSFSLAVIVKMANTVPKQFPSDTPQQWLHIACLAFVLHGTSHIAQKLMNHEDVQRMKKADISIGRERMGELD